MKMTKKFFWLFVIVMLSLFAFGSTLGATPIVDVKKGNFSKKGREYLTFTCKQTGVYAIEFLDGEAGTFCSDWWIEDSDGKCLRIACYKTQEVETGKEYYQLCSPKGSTADTSVKVILQNNKTYTIHTREANGDNITPNHINVVYNSSASNTDYRMSDVSSYERTKVGNQGDEKELEKVPDAYKLPEGAKVKATNVNVIKSTDNQFEKSLVRLLLAVGDFFVKILESIVGEEVTITRLIFNKVAAVDINFFNSEHPGLSSSTIKGAISYWFSYFRRFAILLYLICVLSIGLRLIFNSTAQGMVQAREIFSEWIKGFLYLLLMPYFMSMIITLNEALVNKMEQAAEGKGYTAGALYTDGNIWSVEAIEYRSPEYVSKYTGIMGYGTDQSNTYYLKKVNDYTANFDLTKIARAYAGATFRLSYVFIWFILIGQLITFIFIYFKRYFMVAFFVAIFPIICIFQAIGIMKDGRGSAVSGWLGEFIGNVFTQFIHCVVFVVVTGLATKLLQQSMVEGSLVNWVLIIVAINFVPKGEKIVRQILKAISKGSSVEGIGDGGLKRGFRTLRSGVKNIFHH